MTEATDHDREALFSELAALWGECCPNFNSWHRAIERRLEDEKQAGRIEDVNEATGKFREWYLKK